MTYMFSKDDESTEILCQFKQETSVVIEPFNGSLIASIEEQRTTSLPIDIYMDKKYLLENSPSHFSLTDPEVDHGSMYVHGISMSLDLHASITLITRFT